MIIFNCISTNRKENIMEDIKLHRLIDHTLLKPEATEADVVRLCDEAKKYNFWAVCVNTYYVSLAAADNENIVLLTVDKDISEGSIIR